MEPDNNRCREVQFPGSSNDAFSNDVASHDAAKDVHKKCVHFGVSSDDLESLFHLENIESQQVIHRENHGIFVKLSNSVNLVSSRTAADVQEVGG